MKQLKITLKHVMLIVALTFSAISCQKEEVIQTEVIRIENQTSNYKIQNIGKDIISKNKILSEKLLAFSSKSTDKNSSMSLRDVYNEAYDFTIETDQAIYIENSQYHSYTFTIYRDEPNNLVENLVFSLQDDGSYKTILMKYSLTNEDINAILNNEETQISYDNKVDWETLDINLDGLLYKNYQIGNNLYYNSDSGYCYKEIGIISAATGWEDTQQQVVDCPNDLDTEHFSEDDGGGFTTTNNPDTDPTDTSDPNEGETGNTGNTSNPGNTGNNPPADITTPNISISEQILNCLNSNIDINNPVYYDNAFLRGLGLNLSDLHNYLITQNQCSEEAIEALEVLSTYSETDYPGIDLDYEFEWWLDDDFILNSGNFDLPSDDLPAFEQPNIKELFLFRLYPAAAILHVENSNVALDKAEELVITGVLTGLTNGKADAFRHAYWNALGTAEFGASIMKQFADAHEHGESGLDVDMDLFNNHIGRNIGEGFDFFSSESDISNAILQALYNGLLKYINNLGTLVKSNQ